MTTDIENASGGGFDVMTQPPERPMLRYRGGKWLLAPWIIGNFPAHKIYVEPFGGAASVLLQKTRSYAEVYNDLDNEVVNLFRVVRHRGKELETLLRLTPFARYEFFTSYEPHHDELEQARRTVVRSFMGFGSASASGAKTGFRSNANRSGTTPAHDWQNFADALPIICERLQGVVIENKDYAEVSTTHDGEETLHYFDPPYHLDTRSIKNPYCKKGYRFEMTDAQHTEFCQFAKSLTGKVLISGYPHKAYETALEGWNRLERGALADGARKRTEVIWMNFEPKQKLLL